MQPETLHEDAHHRITRFSAAGGSRRAVVGFEHGRDRMAGFAPPQPPGFARALGIDALVVQTARRDWFISPGSPALAGALAVASRGYAEVVATGFSMGGYAALLYSAACRASRLMLVSPQYSIDPDIAPFDPDRHGKFARIGLPMPRPETWGNTAVEGVLIHDPAIRADRAHAALIRAAFLRLTPVALPHGGHPATGVIGAVGGIGRIAQALVEDRLEAQAIRRAHREARRRAECYRLNLAAAALARHPDRALAELRNLARHGSPRNRFEAGLHLLAAGDLAAAGPLSQLLATGGAIPATWQRRIERALRAAGV
ncbi:hypothetical protein [Paracoccus sp. (in: a-proteobacteria)]|uniref:hypothetical protein n=1 Tax=Paracoccus sp. TaxID=267 RepID=UPI0032209853